MMKNTVLILLLYGGLFPTGNAFHDPEEQNNEDIQAILRHEASNLIVNNDGLIL